MTHAAVPLALAIGLGRKTISRPLLLAGIVACMLPDLDVVSFAMGVPYGSQFGHRGFSHSLSFAALLTLVGAFAFATLKQQFIKAFLFLFVATASHGILDGFTNGGHGIAYLWPWSAERFFAPLQVIQVSPIGVSGMLTARGATVLLSELRWVWLPAIAVALALRLIRRIQATP